MPDEHTCKITVLLDWDIFGHSIVASADETFPKRQAHLHIDASARKLYWVLPGGGLTSLLQGFCVVDAAAKVEIQVCRLLACDTIYAMAH